MILCSAEIGVHIVEVIKVIIEVLISCIITNFWRTKSVHEPQETAQYFHEL